MADIKGTEGDDSIDSGGGDDVIDGGSGSDTILGGLGDDVINGGPGNDEIFDLHGRNRHVFEAGSGNDVIWGFDIRFDMIEIRQAGITFADLRVEAGRLGALVTWGGGEQSITLKEVEPADLTADSFLFDTDAPEVMPDTGTAGDTFTGTEGDDFIDGMAGADTINGLAGDDTLNGGPGADMLDGGPGSDTATYENSAVGVLVRLHDPSAVRFGDAEGDTLTGIEHLVGSRYNDTLAGDGEDNILKGEGGHDVLYGGPAGGDDRLFGGRGNDTRTGGKGMIRSGAVPGRIR